MKIGIFTQPLKNNYGGLLQAFALQKVLNNMGHEVWTVDKPFKDFKNHKRLLSFLKRAAKRYILQKPVVLRIWPTKKEQKIISQHTNRFISENINLTKEIDSDIKIKLLEEYNFDAYIVGSDQVWRPRYSPNLPNYFLDFLGSDSTVKRIAYAASFGVDTWEFNKEQTHMANSLIRKFDTISVREMSAIELCQKYLNTNPTHALDPTLLLSKEDYINHFDLNNQTESKGDLFVYVLDDSTYKDNLINEMASELKLIPFKIKPEKKFQDVGPSRIHETLFPPVEKWLRSFLDAKYVITDSFHGTAFSILFNKPFISIGNKERGLSRFQSILNQLELKERLITENNLAHTLSILKSEVDYNKVNVRIKQMKSHSLQFLISALS